MPHRKSPTTAAPEAASWQTAHVGCLAEMNCLINTVLQEMQSAGFTCKDTFGMRLALEEAIVNGMKHGNREDPAKKVHVRVQVTPQQVTAEIQDEGPGFNPDRVPNPLAPENIERPGGRGVFLMRHYMTSVHFNECGNRVTLCKTRAS